MTTVTLLHDNLSFLSLVLAAVGAVSVNILKYGLLCCDGVDPENVTEIFLEQILLALSDWIDAFFA